jgi:hypothetical protein
MITHILEHYLFLMTRGNGQKVAWQAHDKCAAKSWRRRSPNRGQNNNSKEVKLAVKGVWATKEGGTRERARATTMMGRRQRQ